MITVKAVSKRPKRVWRASAAMTLLPALLFPMALVVSQPVAMADSVQETITTANIRTMETEAGNLLADAVKTAAGSDLAIVPAAAFKPGASAPRPATAEQAAGLVEPATDMIVVLNLRGDQILAALERSVSFAPQPSAGFLQVSGVRFTFDPRKESQKRVSSVTVNGAPLAAAKTYKVATTRPLGNGQQGYSRVWDKNSIASDTGKTLETALKEFSRGGTLSPSVDHRVTQAP